VNNRPLAEYFKHAGHQQVVQSVLGVQDAGIEHYAITAKVLGGGISAQADAIRLGIARALVKEKAARRTTLKKEGFLKRDPRSAKFGRRKRASKEVWSSRSRKARKRPAWRLLSVRNKRLSNSWVSACKLC
jgi:small subunit ribosomal protein S9